MPAQPLTRIFVESLSGGDRGIEPERLCGIGTSLTSTTGAGVILVSNGLVVGCLGSTDKASARIDELQYTLGEGPSIDAYRQERPVLEADLADPDVARWVAFAPAAVAAGARAVFAFPLGVGSARIGVLSLYRDRAGGLTEVQLGDALALSGLIAMTLLVGQHRAPSGSSEPALDPEVSPWPVVHQAAGMVAAQLQVSAAEALVRLRAHAFTDQSSVLDIAHAVVDRQFRFERACGGAV